MIKTINTTTLRNNWKASLDHVRESKQPLVITERAMPTAVLLNIDEFEDLLSVKDQKFLASIAAARKQHAKNDVVSMDELFEKLA